MTKAATVCSFALTFLLILGGCNGNQNSSSSNDEASSSSLSNISLELGPVYDELPEKWRPLQPGTHH